MNFKKIGIYGFKSFADSTTIHFEEGITGIVGPNGCGKSNVADAIRWVLGEQSAKLLRGKNMQDVIFKGTERRSELSVCEVELTFDNTNKIFPNLEYQEVSITRKLYKSNESEYKINGANCRLKDIHNLIRDTGLGREGYSIVGQGKVDEIVNARPKDRRVIFEDAAGILKYKTHKIESERKLANTRENLSRLHDIMSEVGRQLAPLEKQSNDAKKYLEIRDNLRLWETNEFIYRKENIDYQKQEIEQKLKCISEDYEVQTQKQQDSDKEFEKIRIEQNNIDTYISKLRDEQTAMAVIAEGIKGQGNTLNERISGLNEQKISFSQRVEQLELLLETKNQELFDYTNKLSMSQEEYDDTSKLYNSVSSQHLQLVEEIMQRERQIEGSNAEILKTLESLGDIKADMSKLLTEKEISLARIAEIDEEIKNIKSCIDADDKHKTILESGVERLFKEKSRLARNKNEVQAEVLELRTQIDSNKDKASSLNGQLKALQERCTILEAYKNDYEFFGQSVKKLLQSAKSNSQVNSAILGVVGEIVKVPKEYETAIEVLLGGAVQNIVTADEYQANFLINFLKQNSLGRITFLPLTSFKSRELDSYLKSILDEDGCIGVADELVNYDKKFKSIISGLLGRAIVCENMDKAIKIAKKYKYAVKMVTLQGDIINPSGSLTGGSKKSESSNVFSQSREIDNSKIALENGKKNLENLIKQIKSDNEQLQELSDQLVAYEEDVKNSEVAYATESQKLDKVLSRIAELNNDLVSKTTSKQNIVSKVQAIDLALSKINVEGENIKGIKNSADDEATKRKEEFDKKRSLKDKLSEDLTKLKVELSTLENQINANKNNIERLTKECQDAQSEIDNNTRLLETIEQKLYDTQNNLNTIVVSEEDKAKYQQLIDKINSLDEYKKQLNTKMDEVIAQKDNIALQLQNIAENRIKQENILEKMQNNLLSLENHIFEEYELTYDNALMYKLQDFDISKASGEITRLKRERSGLGAVNLDAIEQFKVQGQRYSQMQEQKEDLETTAQDCINIIADMSKEMKIRFDDAFEKINKNFQTIFKELFGGGEGRLVIEKTEEGEDPLEAGVEILAMPPGKTLKSITLFSGGEKALIAIAILFAILRLKAMPFCVLDEIEAALDDANAGLFAKYLSRFSQETQFIVITHRKPTMELADRLYGVTMQEKGVSKIVSVSLSEAVKQTGVGS